MECDNSEIIVHLLVIVQNKELYICSRNPLSDRSSYYI